MMVTLEEMKEWLRADDDDDTINSLILAAEQYLKAGGAIITKDNQEVADLLCKILVTDWYENRMVVGKTSEGIRPIVQSMMLQLQHAEGDSI